MPKCDVVLLVTTLGGGGTERYVQDLAMHLTTSGIRCMVLADNEPLTRKSVLENAGVSVRVLGTSQRWSRAEYVGRLADELRSSCAQVVNAHVWMRSGWQALAAKRAGIPLVRTLHHVYDEPKLNDWLGINRIPFWLYRARYQAKRHPVPIICIAALAIAPLRRILGDHFPAGVVHASVQVPDSKDAEQSLASSPTVLWIGQMTSRKRPEDALRVFQRVQTVVPNVEMIMLGDGPLFGEIAKKAQRISRNIQMIGYTNDIWPHIRRSHVSLQTSEREGLSLALAEGMACGVPAVATSVGATTELVKTGITGYTASPGDVTALAEAACGILRSSSLRNQMSEQARRLVEREFSVQGFVEGTLSFYEKYCGFTRQRE